MSDKNKFGITGEDKTSSNSNPDSSCLVIGDEAFLNVFFDGTKNNIFNTQARLDQKVQVTAKGKVIADEQGNGLEDAESYENDPTSTALMWKSIKNELLLNAVYIEGMGTARGKSDDQDGYAWAIGKTGIPERVQSAFQEIDDALKENRKNELPLRLGINVYGFSRGAAAARHFVHLFNSEGKKFHLNGWPKSKNWYINFVGLFDTVSSYAKGGLGDRNFKNDVGELHLDFGEGYAKKVFHIIAGDEYRKNFSVTTIASAGDKGHEIIIPGAHSDVGGSYVDGAAEERYFQGEKLRDFVYQQGWYKVSDGPNKFENVFHKRKSVSNDYYKVAYTLMVEALNEHLLCKAFPKAPEPAHPLVKALLPKLQAFAKTKKNGRWDLDTEMPDKAQAIRHALFHVSFQENHFAHGPEMVGGLPKRDFMPG